MKINIVLAFFTLFLSPFGANAQLGSLSSDLVFNPVAPCRILDTRAGGGVINAGLTRDIVAWVGSNGNYVSQGGSSSNCGLLAGINVAAVAVNFTVVSPATAGYITAYPFGTTKPLAATVNFIAGDIRGNFAIAKINQSGAASQLSIFTSSTTHIVADIVGFYSKPTATPLLCEVGGGLGVNVFDFSGVVTLTANACPAGTTSTAIYCDSTDPNTPIVSMSPNSCTVRNNGTNGGYLTVSRRCCVIPGR